MTGISKNGKSLSDYPHILSMWDFEKNGDSIHIIKGDSRSKPREVFPSEVSAGSKKKIHWKCRNGSDHEWCDSPANRTRTLKSGCPFCDNLRASVTNSVAALFPVVASEWHPSKNGEITADNCVSSSTKKYWWICKNGHEYRKSAYHRCKMNNGCRKCKFKTLSDFPDILSMWDYRKNGTSVQISKYNSSSKEISPTDISASSMILIHWKCKNGPDHEWCDTPHNRTRSLKSGCPFCDNNKSSVTNSVAALYPVAASEWHPSRNGEMTADNCVSSSDQKYWWICKNGHEYRKSANQRCKMNRGCKKCMSPTSGRMVSDFPEFVKYWSYERNEITPDTCPAGRGTKYWWKCPKGDDHYWLAAPTQIILGGYGCAVCSGKIAVPSTSLSENFPEISSEWHPSKNVDITPNDVTWGSGKRFWWICTKGHEWEDSITHRTGSMKTGCPYCSGNRVSELNNITNNSSELLATWDWKNNDLNPDDVAVSGYQDIAWLCNHCEYRWITKPAWRRTTIITGKWRYTGCPNCSTSGFHTEFPAHVYLISIRNLNDDILFYKLGITNRSPIDERIPEIEKSFMKIKRFSDARIYVEEIIHYENGRDAKDLENSLKIVSEIRLHISEKFTGSTELFIVNPLEYAREIGIID